LARIGCSCTCRCDACSPPVPSWLAPASSDGAVA
jgi:hypothetical protein